MTTGAFKIAEMEAIHYKRAEQFHREQSELLADALQQVIDAVGFEAGPPYDQPLFRGAYSIPRLLDHVREISR